MKRAVFWILAARRRVVLVTICLLLLFDIGRSIYARVGYSSPNEIWQPDQKLYADMIWPPGADLPENTPPGKRIFIKHCAVCHGPDGRGNGPAAPSMIPRPRDFTLGLFKYKTTLEDQPPTDNDLFQIINNGLRASAMPYWRDILKENEIRAVVNYIKSLSGTFKSPPPTPVSISPRVPSDTESINRGKNLYESEGCSECHGDDLRGGITFEDSKGHALRSRDLTAPWTFRGGSNAKQIWLRITTGLAPGPMASFAEDIEPAGRWDVVNYILSKSRIPPWKAGGKLDGPGYYLDPIKRGEYLVHAEMCGLCHTQINHTGIYRGDDFYLAGGMRVGAYPQGVFVTRNLTPDPETGLGNWTPEQIASAIRKGRTPARMLNLFGMPWIFLHAFSEDDAMAIASYLKSRPPVYNRIPAPLEFGFLETIIAKSLRLPQASPTFLSYGDGNFGQTNPEEILRDLPQGILLWSQKLIFFVGIVSFVFAAPKENRFPRNLRAWIKTFFITLGFTCILFIGWIVYKFPVLSFIPTEQIPQAIQASIPMPDPSKFKSPEQAALIKRGRYIFSVASCAFCHGGKGSGGMKVSWKAFGTLWVRNISSDRETGIGAWTDEQVKRAIRSGVRPNGETLHWQGMIWDHLSNLDEEDIRAVIAYLRTLPPVKKKIPESRPPSSDDCQTYTFWITESEEYGCN